jgi:hypothetical protein
LKKTYKRVSGNDLPDPTFLTRDEADRAKNRQSLEKLGKASGQKETPPSN